MNRLSVAHRRVLIRSWRHADEFANKISTNFFQFTNHAGHWLVNCRGEVKRCYKNKMECVRLKDLKKMSLQKERNKDWKGEDHLDISSCSNWQIWNEEQATTAFRHCLKCGGGKYFNRVPAALIAAVVRINKKKWFRLYNVSPISSKTIHRKLSNESASSPKQKEQTMHCKLAPQKKIAVQG